MNKIFATSLALALTAALSAHADTLGPNSTLSPAPAGTTGSQTQIVTTGYRTLSAPTFSVGYAETVLTDSTSPYAGGLEFAYAFNNIGATGQVESVSMFDYNGFLVNAFYETKTDGGMTDIAPASITRSVDPTTGASVIRFNFSPAVQAGQDSDYLILQTNATSYQTGTFTFQDGSTTQDLNVFAPSAVTPEPSSLILLGTGLLGAAGAARRKFSL